jgi:glycosyltransferase involved in cell wall biosynthesis
LFNDTIKKLNLVENVNILSGDTDQSEFLDNITFSLIPSINEGLSLTAIESQACGIKVFASTGLPKEVDIGNIEFLPLNAKLWADSIHHSFEKQKNIRKKVDISKFSNKLFKEKMLSIYKD